MAMSSRMKIALYGSLAMVVAVGIRLWLLERERNAPDKAETATVQTKTDDDDLVFLKKLRPSSYKDLHDVVGKPLWVSAGGQMDYYPYAGHKVDYAHSAGILLGAQELEVKDTAEAKAPKSAAFRIPAGDHQYLLVFSLPAATTPGASANADVPAGQTDADKLYAVPVGYGEHGQDTFYTDEIFFYDNPHTLYNYWPKTVWQAVDAHRAVLGMNERQTQLALGQISKSESADYGNRTVSYDNRGHAVDVTYLNNKATRIDPR
jgi:hypothetical protein